jgi:hypothetical protein
MLQAYNDGNTLRVLVTLSETDPYCANVSVCALASVDHYTTAIGCMMLLEAEGLKIVDLPVRTTDNVNCRWCGGARSLRVSVVIKSAVTIPAQCTKSKG